MLLDELQDLAEAADAGRGQRLYGASGDSIDADAVRPEARGHVAHRGFEARLRESHGVVVRHDARRAEVRQR